MLSSRMLLLLPACAALTFAAIAASAPPSADPLTVAVRSTVRSPSFVARDPARQPVAVLRFLGVTPRSRVVEIWPGNGYWTQILAPLVARDGRYTAALGSNSGDQIEQLFAPAPRELAVAPNARALGFRQANLGTLGRGRNNLGTRGSADVVLTFRNLHNWVAAGDAPEMLAAIHQVLRPSGVLGIEDHRARPDRPQDPRARDGYLRQDYTIALVEKAGFRLVGSSELLANPRDTTHWPRGVWTLPPVYRLGNVDRAKYQAIGEADNYLLKFRKVV